MNNLGFTEEQKQWICDQIDDWYLYWKNKIVNYYDKTHQLGWAKESLKTMICSTDEEKLQMFYEIASSIQKSEYEDNNEPK